MTDLNATKHMTESVHRLGGGLSGPIRSQTTLTSYVAAVDEALDVLLKRERARGRINDRVFGGWEIGVDLDKRVVYHARWRGL